MSIPTILNDLRNLELQREAVVHFLNQLKVHEEALENDLIAEGGGIKNGGHIIQALEKILQPFIVRSDIQKLKKLHAFLVSNPNLQHGREYYAYLNFHAISDYLYNKEYELYSMLYFSLNLTSAVNEVKHFLDAEQLTERKKDIYQNTIARLTSLKAKVDEDVISDVPLEKNHARKYLADFKVIMQDAHNELDTRHFLRKVLENIYHSVCMVVTNVVDKVTFFLFQKPKPYNKNEKRNTFYELKVLSNIKNNISNGMEKKEEPPSLKM